MTDAWYILQESIPHVFDFITRLLHAETKTEPSRPHAWPNPSPLANQHEIQSSNHSLYQLGIGTKTYLEESLQLLHLKILFLIGRPHVEREDWFERLEWVVTKERLCKEKAFAMGPSIARQPHWLNSGLLTGLIGLTEVWSNQLSRTSVERLRPEQHFSQFSRQSGSELPAACRNAVAGSGLWLVSLLPQSCKMPNIGMPSSFALWLRHAALLHI